MGKRQQWEKDEGGVSKRRNVAAAAADTIDDLDNLECLICRQPLRPPIFQVSPVFDLLIQLKSYEVLGGWETIAPMDLKNYYMGVLEYNISNYVHY